MRRITLLLVITVLAACAGRDFYSEGTAVTAADQQILQTIQRAFWEFDGIDETDLVIVVDHGDVWVSGEISNTEERKRILDVLREADGVRGINLDGLKRA